VVRHTYVQLLTKRSLTALIVWSSSILSTSSVVSLIAMCSWSSLLVIALAVSRWRRGHPARQQNDMSGSPDMSFDTAAARPEISAGRRRRQSCRRRSHRGSGLTIAVSIRKVYGVCPRDLRVRE